MGPRSQRAVGSRAHVPTGCTRRVAFSTRKSDAGEGAKNKKPTTEIVVGEKRVGEKWLPDKDSNLNKQSQNLLCYHYTIGQ